MAADIMAFYGRMPDHAVRARVLERDGEVVAVAGHYVTPAGAVVFSDVKPGVPKLRIWREAVALMKSINMPAICEGSDESAPFLERLGWVRLEGDVFKWQA